MDELLKEITNLKPVKSDSTSLSRYAATILGFVNNMEQNGCAVTNALRPIYTVQLLLTTVARDFWSARCSRHAKNRTQLSSLNIAYTYDCRRILKHVLKSYDIFYDVHDSRKRVVGLIYTIHFVT